MVSMLAGEFGFESEAVARSLAEPLEPELYDGLPVFMPEPLLPELPDAPRSCALDTWSAEGGLCVGVGVGLPPALLALELLEPLSYDGFWLGEGVGRVLDESVAVMLPCTSAADFTSEVELDFEVSLVSLSREPRSDASLPELRSEA